MSPSDYPTRYIHIAGGFAAGGTLTRIHPNTQINLQLPSVTPVDLPMVGGKSEASASGVVVKGRDAGVASLTPEQMERELFSVGSAHSLVQSDTMVDGGPAGSRTLVEVSKVVIASGELSIDSCRLAMRSVHDRQSKHPRISLEGTEIVGLRLGDHAVQLTLDLDPFNRYPTLADLEQAFQSDPDLRRELTPRFVIDPKTGTFYRNESGYVVGSMLKSVSGLPPDAALENGYTINWRSFGKIIIGEVFMGAYVRRATLVRIVHSDGDVGSGCSGGSWYP